MPGFSFFGSRKFHRLRDHEVNAVSVLSRIFMPHPGMSLRHRVSTPLAPVKVAGRAVRISSQTNLPEMDPEMKSGTTLAAENLVAWIRPDSESRHWQLLQPNPSGIAVAGSDEKIDHIRRERILIMKLQTALITGASSGIGKALARKFANSGYDVVVVARHEDMLEDLAAELSLYRDISVTVIAKDLTREEAPQEIYDELKARNILVDVLVNDAGIGQRGIFHETDLQRSISIIRLNVEALTRLTSLFLKDMVARNSGKILNVGSAAGFEPGPLAAVYHASKAYVISFSEALAEEIKDTNVQITVICPGPTDTDFFRKAGMTDLQDLNKDFVMEPQEVANIGYEGLIKGERLVIPVLRNKFVTMSRSFVPASFYAGPGTKAYGPLEYK